MIEEMDIKRVERQGNLEDLYTLEVTEKELGRLAAAMVLLNSIPKSPKTELTAEMEKHLVAVASKG